MKMLARAGLVLSIALGAGMASAAPVVPVCTMPNDGTFVACPGVQETLSLASANVAAPAQKAYGGNYVFAQMASGYGTIALQVLGPDRATYETIASKTASDASGGTVVQIPGGATVQVVLTGTTGANVTLSRLP